MAGIRAQELYICESRGGRPDSPYGLCGCVATLNVTRPPELCESRGGHPGLPVLLIVCTVSWLSLTLRPQKP